MDKTKGYQASIDYLMPIVAHPVMTGEYCRHLRNSIDAMIKFERIQSELERLNAENAKLQAELALLRKVVEAARRAYDYYDMVWDGGIAHELGQAFAELDKEGE